jgi:hypothetical protein
MYSPFLTFGSCAGSAEAGIVRGIVRTKKIAPPATARTRSANKTRRKLSSQPYGARTDNGLF